MTVYKWNPYYKNTAIYAITTISIGVAGDGVAVLNKLRDYRLEKINDNKIILHKK